MKKRIMTVAAVIILAIALMASCGKAPAGNDNTKTDLPATAQPTDAPAATATEAPTDVPTEAPTEAVTGAAVSGTTLEVVNDTITINTREQLFEFARLANEKVYVPYEDGEEGNTGTRSAATILPTSRLTATVTL